MLYTIVGLGDVFAAEQMSFYDMRKGNVWLTVRRTGQLELVERLVSTNPYDYLNPCLLPGRNYDEKILTYMKFKGKESFSNGKQLEFNQKRQFFNQKEEIRRPDTKV